MKKLLFCFVILATATLGFADTSEKRTSLANELVEISGLKDTLSRTLKFPIDQTPKNETEDTVSKIMQSAFSWETLKKEYTDIYAEIFTETELQGLVDFYKSAAGKAYVEKQDLIVKKSMELSHKIMADVAKKMAPILEKEQKKSISNAKDVPPQVPKATASPNTIK